MASIGSIVPFLALLADPAMAIKYPLLQTILTWFGAEDGNYLLAAGIVFCVATLAASLIRTLLLWCNLRFSFGLGADIGGEVYRRTLHQPYSWHVSQNSSEILSGIEKVNTVVVDVLASLMHCTVALLMSISILVMLITIDWKTALISGIGFSMMYTIITFTFRAQVQKNSQIISANMTRRVQAIQEGLGGIRDVVLDGTQPVYHRKFAEFDYAMRRAQASYGVISNSPRYLIEAAGTMLIVALAYWLSPRQGGITAAIPVLGALAIGAQKLLPQMQLFYASWSAINGARSQLSDLLLLLTPTKTDGDRQSLSSKVNLIYDKDNNHNNIGKKIIVLDKISFRYKADTPEVLNNISLEIDKGARVGFVGKTGSGKSTLIDLVMGLLEPSSGQIKVAGMPLNEVNRRAWQQRIAHVPQSIYLSDSTIAENIAFGVPADQIDLFRLKDAIKKAQLNEFIEKLPLKLYTKVGERGIRLSGGQRQRIGLARALYKKADVLILDEATSALDDDTEKSVMTAIKALGGELTVLMIAHRVTTLRECNLIVALEYGIDVRIGSYEELISIKDYQNVINHFVSDKV
jgi:ABC-type bacteriocin/lantibiotic exporter with double-glycine peptidase domain